MARIALGVTGGISAYKSVDVVRRLQQEGHEVTAVMTKAACRFVGPVTFEAITRRPVITDQFKPNANADIEHIALASEIDLFIVAPATANTIGKFVHGIADDFLSSLYLATQAPVLIAPAMNTNMLMHQAVQANLKCLYERGVHVVEPGEGYLACGWIGKGRLAEAQDIVTTAQELLRPRAELSEKTILVTAGPTYEDLDPVRYLGNRATGRMGFSVAAEAAARGARVVLVTGPTTLEPPVGVEVVRVRSAQQMHTVVFSQVDEVDAVVMAAAVADYTPIAGPNPEKLKKQSNELTVTLSRTSDILAELGAKRAGCSTPVLIGFAAETSDLVSKARQKLRAKNLDLIVANDISQPGVGFESSTNAASLITEEDVEVVSLRKKRELARVILDRLHTLLNRVVPVSTE